MGWFLDKKKSEIARAYQTLFDTPQGKIVLADLYNVCRMGKDNVAQGNLEALPYYEGRRSVFLQIMRYRTVDATVLERMEEDNT